MLIELSSVIEKIHLKYSDSYPNGIQAGWDMNRFFKALILIFSGYKLTNQTDFNYSFCNSYDVVLDKNTDGSSSMLTIKVSYICDVFSLHMTRHGNRRKTQFVPLNSCNEFKNKAELARAFLIDKGFREIQPEEMDVEIDGIELELAEIATVGKCLFDDFE